MTYATRIPHTGAPLSPTERAAFRIGYAYGLRPSVTTQAKYHAVRDNLRKVHVALRPTVAFHVANVPALRALVNGLLSGEREAAERGDRVNSHLSGAR